MSREAADRRHIVILEAQLRRALRSVPLSAPGKPPWGATHVIERERILVQEVLAGLRRIQRADSSWRDADVEDLVAFTASAVANAVLDELHDRARASALLDVAFAVARSTRVREQLAARRSSLGLPVENRQGGVAQADEVTRLEQRIETAANAGRTSRRRSISADEILRWLVLPGAGVSLLLLVALALPLLGQLPSVLPAVGYPFGSRAPARVAAVSAQELSVRLVSQDADPFVAMLRAQLPPAWSRATLGAGSLRVVDANADVVINVLSGVGESVYRPRSGASRGSREIDLYAADRSGALAPDTLLLLALHELGHIWCCYGPGTQDGHWTDASPVRSTEDVESAGLMNHPLTCVATPRGNVCPTRFSQRELIALGLERR